MLTTSTGPAMKTGLAQLSFCKCQCHLEIMSHWSSYGSFQKEERGKNIIRLGWQHKTAQINMYHATKSPGGAHSPVIMQINPQGALWDQPPCTFVLIRGNVTDKGIYCTAFLARGTSNGRGVCTTVCCRRQRAACLISTSPLGIWGRPPNLLQL